MLARLAGGDGQRLREVAQGPPRAPQMHRAASSHVFISLALSRHLSQSLG